MFFVTKYKTMDIIEKLSSKIPMCTEQTLLDWWGVNDLPTTPALVEWDDSGCFIISTQTITYCNFSIGRTQKITKKINPENWDLLQKLYIKCSLEKIVRMDLPVKREILEIDGVKWEYTETVRPGTGNGENFYKFYENEEAMEKETDAIIAIIKAASEVSSKIPLFKASLLRHDADGFYFYTDWGEWSYDTKFVIDYNLHHLRNYLSSNFKNWQYPDFAFGRLSQKWRALANGY